MYTAEALPPLRVLQAKVALRAAIPTADNPLEAAPQCTMVRRVAIAIILDVLARLHPAQAAAVRLHHHPRVVAAHHAPHIADALVAQAIREVVVAIADILHRLQAQVHHALAVAIVDVREALLHPNLEAAVLIRLAAVRRRLIVDALVAHHLIIALAAAPAVEAVLQAVMEVRAVAPAAVVHRAAADNTLMLLVI